MYFRIMDVRMKLLSLLTEVEKLHARISEKANTLSGQKAANLEEANGELYWARAYLSRADVFLKRFEEESPPGRPRTNGALQGPRRPVGRPRRKRLPQ